MTTFRFFSYCPECGEDTHKTAQDAKAIAEKHLEHFREEACEGWSEGVDQIYWGEIKGKVQEIERRPYNAETDLGIDPSCECVVDYSLVDLGLVDLHARVAEMESFAFYVLEHSSEPEIIKNANRVLDR